MDDDYVLKYIPVMTEEGKKVHFGETYYNPDTAIIDLDKISTDKINKRIKRDPEFAAYIRLLRNESLNQKIDSILPPYKKKPNYPKFKNRLFYFLSQIKSNVEWRNKIYTPLDAQKFERDINRINKALSKITYHPFFKKQYTVTIIEQLQKQNPDMDSFESFDIATAIADFSENMLPLMQKAAKNAWDYAEKYGEDMDKIDIQGAIIKKDVARVVAFLLKNYLDAPVQNSSKSGISKFDDLFIACCEVVGFKDVSPKSDHVQEAVRNLKTSLPNHLQRFVSELQKTSMSETR